MTRNGGESVNNPHTETFERIQLVDFRKRCSVGSASQFSAVLQKSKFNT